MGLVRTLPGRLLLPMAVVVLGALGLTACHTALRITASPALYPGFHETVFDYVNRCDPANPTSVTVEAPAGTTVSVDGQQARSGNFTVEVTQDIGDRFTIRISTQSGTTSHSVRCLPQDFPQWSFERSATPQAAYYTTVLNQTFNAPAYAVVFDTNGVPLWWLRNQINALLWTLLPNGHFATDLVNGPAQEYNTDGGLVRQLNTAGGSSDFHDIILLPNGDYVLATAQNQACDLTSWDKPANSTCINHVFQELTPQGNVVWSWNTAAHIPVTETTATWRNDNLNSQSPFDPWHYNSVESTGDGFIISFRHLDAIFKINKASGAIVWKLGGTHRPESLAVIGDPVFTSGGSFSGQHDARLKSPDVVSLYDNGSKIRAPRSVAYRVDEDQETATLIHTLTDSRFPNSGCCGSTRQLPGGDWVTGWGSTQGITEHRNDGQRVLTITNTTGFVYRGLPVLAGQLDRDVLRAGLDKQYSK